MSQYSRYVDNNTLPWQNSLNCEDGSIAGDRHQLVLASGAATASGVKTRIHSGSVLLRDKSANCSVRIGPKNLVLPFFV